MSRSLPYFSDNANDEQAVYIYLEAYHRNAGTLIQLESYYLIRSLSRLYMHGRKAKAGYCLNTASMHKLRYADPFSDQDWQMALQRKHLQEDDLLEVAAVYTEPDLSLYRKGLFFLEMLVDTHQTARKLSKKYIILGTMVPGIAPYVQKVLQKSLYDGFYPVSGKLVWLTISVARTESLLLRATVYIIQKFVLGWLRTQFGTSRNSSRRANKSLELADQEPANHQSKTQPVSPKGRFYISKKRHFGRFALAGHLRNGAAPFA